MSTAPVFRAAPDDLAAHVAVPGAVIELDGPEGRHAAAVLRLEVGEELDLVDGTGARVSGVVSYVRERSGVAVEVRCRVEEPARRPSYTLVQALPKGDRGELAVELATELGVDQIVPWSAARCVTKWVGERGDKARRRWAETAAAAAKQSRRAWWPEVAPLATTTEVARRCGAASLAVVLHEGAAAPLAGVELPAAGEVVLVVGPEGGLADTELEALGAVGARGHRLGPEVLRTSTAGAAALSLLSAASRWR